MAVSLGGVTLPDDTDWPDRRVYRPAAASFQWSIDGTAVVFANAINNQAINIKGAEDRAWITTDTADDLQALADDPGAELVFIYGSFSADVVIVNIAIYPVELHIENAWWWFDISLITVD